MNVDLHMHTSCSDGVYTPEELLTMAETAQLGEISITDHDTVEAYSHPCVVSSSVSVIRGIEISTEYNGEDIHVLGYYIHTEHKAIAEYCQTFHQRRLERALQIVDRLAGLGYELDRTPLEGLIKQGVVWDGRILHECLLKRVTLQRLQTCSKRCCIEVLRRMYRISAVRSRNVSS